MDFSNANFYNLRSVKINAFDDILAPMLTNGEEIIQCFQTVRDGVVFTDKRIVIINIQGLVGKKKDFTVLPYSRIQAFSAETSGVLDVENVLVLWLYSLGPVRFSFLPGADISMLCRAISNRIL